MVLSRTAEARFYYEDGQMGGVALSPGLRIRKESLWRAVPGAFAGLGCLGREGPGPVIDPSTIACIPCEE